VCSSDLKKINLVRKIMLKDGIMSLYGLDSKKNIDMTQKKMMKDLREGDVIIAYQGGYTLGGIGVVIQSHFQDDSGDAFDSFYESTRNFIRVDWLFKGPLKISDFFLDDQRIPAFSMWGDAIHMLTPDQVRRFSDYLYTKDIQINENGVHTRSRTYEVVPVGCNWTDSTFLLGTMDRAGDKYNGTKTLDLILNAGKVLKRGMDNPFFLILDNINESRVENYLSEILSVWETGETVTLHRDDDIAQFTEIPKDLSIPSNLFIIGTTSSDDKAERLSRSILGKAGVIEMDGLNPVDYLIQGTKHPSVNRDLCFQESPMANLLMPEDIRKLMAGVAAGDNDSFHVLDRLAVYLDKLSKILSSFGFDLGCRVVNDMVRFVYLCWEAQDKPAIFSEWSDALDVQIVQRVLPGLWGESSVLKNAMNCLYGYCCTDVTEDEMDNLCKGKSIPRLTGRSPEEAWLARSAFKLKSMMKNLEIQGNNKPTLL
jgi:hypothetical protein